DPSQTASAIVTLTSTTVTAGSGVSWRMNTASPSTSATISVNWTAPSNATPYDTIALSATDAPDWWSISLHDTSGAASGTFELDPPLAPGRYELRYIHVQPNGNGTVTARSAPLGIGLSGFKLTASPGLVSPGGPVRVDWTAASGRTD